MMIRLTAFLVPRIRSSLILLLVGCAVANAAELRGRVVDETGAAIPGARVELVSGTQNNSTTSDGGGNFALRSAPEEGVLRVSAAGFTQATLSLRGASGLLTVTLKPAPVSESVVVTGDREQTPLRATAANVVLLTAPEVETHAAPTLDDALRQVPGFTLFRRSNGLTANPTTQGASARGVGASGASRMLVLEDGVPLNDPFGGWVFWDRVPRIAIDRAEVLRGGGSALYGSSAIGGVVELLTAETARQITVETSGDSLDGHDVQGRIAGQFRGWTLSGNGETFGNDGAFVVASRDRGLVDRPSALSFSDGTGRLDHKLGESGTVFASGSLFAEARNNGTALQINSTHLGEVTTGADLTLGRNVLSVRAYGTGEHYHQSFSAIAADRSSETLTRWQTAPSDQMGFSAQWTRPLASTQVSAGVDGSFIHGESDETAFTANIPTTLSASGGRSENVGAFAEISAPLARRLRASGGVRVDRWRNLEGFTRTTKFASKVTVLSPLASRDETAVSPRAGLVYELTREWQLTGSAYGGFRAPTLNELYRSFRLGNVLTLANEQLGAEHLAGGEAGIRYLRHRMMMSGVFFQENVDDPVGNITQSVTPALITRQRQNMGSLRARGTDADFVFLVRNLQLRAGYEYVHSLVTSFSAQPVLVGKTVPQVPAHVLTLTTVYSAPRHWTVTGLLRAASHQFDDDQNGFPLAPYSVLGISISRQTGMVTWFASAANLLDTRIETAATPVLNYASPRIISGGVRFSTPR